MALTATGKLLLSSLVTAGPNEKWRKSAPALMIPAIMVACPAVGLILGKAFQAWLGWGNWIVVTMLFIGLAASANEVYQLIRKMDA